MERQVIHITSLFELGFTSTIFIFQNEKPHFRLLKTGFIDNLRDGYVSYYFRIDDTNPFFVVVANILSLSITTLINSVEKTVRHLIQVSFQLLLV